jgi:histidine triad (HIT) family protein
MVVVNLDDARLALDASCIFCKIVQQKAPASIIYEDATVMAFLDIRPLNMGHTLVITKSHYVDIFDTPEEQLSQLYRVTKQIAIAIEKVTKADGISVIQQNGKAAGQDIFHLHVHVVPRFTGQKLPQFSDLKEVERTKLDDMANKIKEKL